jgi:hypothetical protein
VGQTTSHLQSETIDHRIAALCKRRTWSRWRVGIRPGSLCLFLIALAGLAEGNAYAASIDARERAARKACLDGDFAKGVSMLSDLFLDTHDSTFIFNQGRCLEQNRRYEDAIARFQEYLHVAESSRLRKSDRAAAQKHIEDCRKELPTKSSPPPNPLPTPPAALPAASPPTPPTPAPALSPPVSQPTVSVPSVSPAKQDGAAHDGLRTTGIVTAAVGGAALIAGVVLNLKVNSMASDLEKPGSYSNGKESDRKTYETWGWVSYGVGAAFVAAGTVLYVLGHRNSSSGPGSVAVLPSASPDHVGAVLRGGF